MCEGIKIKILQDIPFITEGKKINEQSFSFLFIKNSEMKKGQNVNVRKR